MQILINNASMMPLYEQIVNQIRMQIKEGQMTSGTPLPSVRNLAKQCAISALTVKKAYDVLEEEGLIVTVAGKGSCVANISANIVEEEMNRQIEALFEQAIETARARGLSSKEIQSIVSMLLEEE